MGKGFREGPKHKIGYIFVPINVLKKDLQYTSVSYAYLFDWITTCF